MAVRRWRDNQPLEWTGPASRSSWFESWSAPGRPFNVDPLARTGATRMSDSMFKLIPVEREFVPPAEKHQAAIRRLEEFAPEGEEVEVRVHPHLEFIDQGENLEAVLCPSCGKRLQLDHLSEADPICEWWDQASIEADVHRGEDVFELNPDATCQMPCCQARVKFIDLEFDWPAGFSKFELTVSNPNLETLTQRQIQELEQVVGCQLKLIRAYY